MYWMKLQTKQLTAYTNVQIWKQYNAVKLFEPLLYFWAPGVSPI